MSWHRQLIPGPSPPHLTLLHHTFRFRYYRVMAMNRDSTAADANRAAEAFRLVALTWMARSQVSPAGRWAVGSVPV